MIPEIKQLNFSFALQPINTSQSNRIIKIENPKGSQLDVPSLLAHHFQTQFCLFEKGMKSSFFAKIVKEESILQFKDNCYLEFFHFTANLISLAWDISDYQVNKTPKSIQTWKDQISSPKVRQIIQKSFEKFKGNHSEAINKIINDVLNPLLEIEKTFQYMMELSSLPKGDIHALLLENKEGNFYPKDYLMRYKEFLLSFKSSAIPPLPEFIESIDLSLDFLEIIPQGNCEKIWEKSEQILKLRSKMFEGINLSLQSHFNGNSSDEARLIFMSYITFIDMIITHTELAFYESDKKFQCIASQAALIDLNIIWKKLSLLNDKIDLSDIENKLQLTFQAVPKTSKCLNKLQVLMQHSQDPCLIASLGDFINDEKLCYIRYSKLKDNAEKLKKDATSLESLMQECNKELQQKLNGSKLSSEEVKELQEMILKIKADLSSYLAPLLKLPQVLNNLIYNAKKEGPKQKTYQPDLDDDIKNLFRLDFSKCILKEPLKLPILEKEKEEEMIVQIEKEKAQVIAIKDRKILLPPVFKKEKKLKNDDRPQTNKRDEILAYLDEKGWQRVSMHSSHLKLKKEGEMLIVPVTKDRIAKGTLGSILKEFHEKEEKIAARRLS